MKGRKLKRLREKHWNSQNEMADEIGVPRSAISHWENNLRDIPLYIQILIEKIIKEKQKQEG